MVSIPKWVVYHCDSPDDQTITNAIVKWYRNEPVYFVLICYIWYENIIHDDEEIMVVQKSYLQVGNGYKTFKRSQLAFEPSEPRLGQHLWETIFLDWDWVLFIITSLFSSGHELLRGWSYDMLLFIWVLNLWSIARWGFKCRFKHFFSVKAGSE